MLFLNLQIKQLMYATLTIIINYNFRFTKVNTSICNTPKKLSIATPTPNRKHSLTATTVNENAGNSSVSRDLFIDKQTTSTVDDFIGAFSKLDDRDQDVKTADIDHNHLLLQKRNESDLQRQLNNSTILDKSLNNNSNNIVDVTFSPILTQNKNRNSNCSTPIKSSSRTTTAQLNTSTPLGGGNNHNNSTNNRSKGSKNSSFEKS